MKNVIVILSIRFFIYLKGTEEPEEISWTLGNKWPEHFVPDGSDSAEMGPLVSAGYNPLVTPVYILEMLTVCIGYLTGHPADYRHRSSQRLHHLISDML